MTEKQWELFVMFINNELPEDKVAEFEAFRADNPDLDSYSKVMVQLVGELPKSRRFTKEELSAKYWELFPRLRLSGNIKRRRKAIACASGVAAAVIVGLFAFNMWVGSRADNLSVDDLVPAQKRQIEVTLDNGEIVRLYSQETVSLPNAVLDDEGLRYEAGQQTVAGAMNTITVPNAATLKTILSDGTVVYLNSASRLRFPVAFSDTERRVELIGEAYFEVTADRKKPFVIETKNQSVTVLGTSFNVSAYGEQAAESVVLVSGSVRLEHGGTSKIISPGEMATLAAGSQQYEVQNVNARNYTAWKDGVFIFNRMPLNEIMDKLARWYDVEIEFADESVGKLHFTGAVEKEWLLSYVLEMISSTTEIVFRNNGQAVIIGRQ